MSRGTTVFAVIVSVLLIAAAGVLNMLARQSGEALLADAVVMATEVRDGVPKTGASTVDGFLETASRLVATLESVPDLAAGITGNAAALREGLQQRKLTVDAILDADAELAEAVDAWKSAVGETGARAPDLAGLVADMDLFLDGAGPAPSLDAVRSHGDVTLVAAADRLASDMRTLDELHQGLAADSLADVAEQFVMSLEIERARRALVVRNYDDATVAALGALVLLWVLVGIRGRRSEPERQTANPAAGKLFIRGTAAAVTVRAQRLASQANALRQSRQRLEDAITEAGLDRSLHDDAPLHREVEALDAHLASLRNETGELSALGKRLWTLAGEAAPAASTVSINACIREALEAIRAGHRIPVMTELADVGDVRGVASDIVLALTALIERILAASRDSGSGHSAVRVFTTTGDEQVHVTITGGAPLPRFTEHVFRPSGASHELALAIALLRRHGGSVVLGSSPAGEASARISLVAASGDQT